MVLHLCQSETQKINYKVLSPSVSGHLASIYQSIKGLKTLTPREQQRTRSDM